MEVEKYERKNKKRNEKKRTSYQELYQYLKNLQVLNFLLKSCKLPKILIYFLTNLLDHSESRPAFLKFPAGPLFWGFFYVLFSPPTLQLSFALKKCFALFIASFLFILIFLAWFCQRQSWLIMIFPRRDFPPEWRVKKHREKPGKPG